MDRETLRASIRQEVLAALKSRGVDPAAPLPPVTAASMRPAVDPAVGGVAIASDHGGFAMKLVLIKHVESLGFPVQDLGPSTPETVDYPDYARAVAVAVAQGRASTGIMIDGVGVGSTMAANKVPGIRAAMCTDLFEVNNAREHNNGNVLCLGGKTLGEELAKSMVAKWLSTPFAGGRHQRRVDKIMAIEAEYLSAPATGRRF